MEISSAVKALSALAQESRLSIFRTLVQAGEEGLAAGQIAKKMGIPNATLSFHLKELSNAGLISARQENRFIYYAAHFEAMNELLAFLTENCCGGNPCGSVMVRCDEVSHMSERIFNVLFLCTGNSARSILAEGLLHKLGAGRFRAFSAGSHPTGTVNPLALERLQQEGISLPEARSKSWDEFAHPDAPGMDFVITVCDQAAGESCPLWPGQPITAHWGVADPVGNDEHEQRIAFAKAFAVLERRIQLLTNLQPEKLERLALEREIRKIGRVENDEK